MNRNVYAVLNKVLDVLPGYGAALDLRGRLARHAMARAGKRLRISRNVEIYNPQNVEVGSHVYIGYNTYIGGGRVVLDDEVIIGPFCSIIAGNHTMKDGSFRYGPYDSGEIRIGKGTWLASHVTVTSNVSIGEGCLIAANSVITQDISAYSMVGGVPGKIIRRLDTV